MTRLALALVIASGLGSLAGHAVAEGAAASPPPSPDSSDTQFDPMVGARDQARLSNRWSATGYDDMGGFGVSLKSTGQVYGGFDYHVGERWLLSGGYRYYKVKFTNVPIRPDTTMHGPFVGAAYRF